MISQVSNVSDESRIATIQADLKTIRSQLQVYAVHHRGEFPSLAAITEQLTLASDADGATAEAGTDGFPYGPYMTRIPPNPITLTDTVSSGDVGTSAWYYDEATGDFRANDSDESREY